MANTLSLQNTLLWCLPFLKYFPQAQGQTTEPAVSNANLVLQTILGAPFCWRWNRSSKNFPITNAAQDYAQLIADFGFIEKAYLLTGAAPVTAVNELSVRSALSKEAKVARPQYVAAQLDDNAGNITLRFNSIVDKNYTAEIIYQKKAPLMSSLASLWTPVPDEFSYIFNWGFLTLSAICANDPRFPIFNQKFISALLGASDGLDAMQKNIFVGNWTELTKMLERDQLTVQNAAGARTK